MKKSFFDESDKYTQEALDFEFRVVNILRPLYEEYIKRGYSKRAIAHIMSSAVFDLQCEMNLD